MGDELRGHPDQRLLDLAVEGRNSGDSALRRRGLEAWRHLVARQYPRLRGLVVAFEFPGQPGVRIPAAEYDDATQECYIRAAAMFRTFRGAAMPQFTKALRTCVSNTCMDYCRRTLGRERGLAGSIDEPARGSDDETSGRFDADVGEAASRAEDDRAAAREELDAVAKAIARLENADMRAVLRKTMEGATSKQIADELELTVANVDQLRSRGLKLLKGLMSDE